MKSTDFTETIEYNNINSNNFEGIFQHISMDKLIVNFTYTTTPVNMEVLIINQNMQRIMYGMAGNAYAH